MEAGQQIGISRGLKETRFVSSNGLGEVSSSSEDELDDYDYLMQKISGDFGVKSAVVVAASEEPEYKGVDTLVLPLYIPKGAVPIRLARIARSGNPDEAPISRKGDLLGLKISPTADSVLLRRVGSPGGPRIHGGSPRKRDPLPQRQFWHRPVSGPSRLITQNRRSDNITKRKIIKVSRTPTTVPPTFAGGWGQRLVHSNNNNNNDNNEDDEETSKRSKKNELSKTSQFPEKNVAEEDTLQATISPIDENASISSPKDIPTSESGAENTTEKNFPSNISSTNSNLSLITSSTTSPILSDTSTLSTDTKKLKKSNPEDSNSTISSQLVSSEFKNVTDLTNVKNITSMTSDNKKSHPSTTEKPIKTNASESVEETLETLKSINLNGNSRESLKNESLDAIRLSSTEGGEIIVEIAKDTTTLKPISTTKETLNDKSSKRVHVKKPNTHTRTRVRILSRLGRRKNKKSTTSTTTEGSIAKASNVEDEHEVQPLKEDDIVNIKASGNQQENIENKVKNDSKITEPSFNSTTATATTYKPSSSSTTPNPIESSTLRPMRYPWKRRNKPTTTSTTTTTIRTTTTRASSLLSVKTKQGLVKSIDKSDENLDNPLIRFKTFDAKDQNVSSSNRSVTVHENLAHVNSSKVRNESTGNAVNVSLEITNVNNTSHTSYSQPKKNHDQVSESNKPLINNNSRVKSFPTLPKSILTTKRRNNSETNINTSRKEHLNRGRTTRIPFLQTSTIPPTPKIKRPFSFRYTPSPNTTEVPSNKSSGPFRILPAKNVPISFKPVQITTRRPISIKKDIKSKTTPITTVEDNPLTLIPTKPPPTQPFVFEGTDFSSPQSKYKTAEEYVLEKLSEVMKDATNRSREKYSEIASDIDALNKQFAPYGIQIIRGEVDGQRLKFRYHSLKNSTISSTVKSLLNSDNVSADIINNRNRNRFRSKQSRTNSTVPRVEENDKQVLTSVKTSFSYQTSKPTESNTTDNVNEVPLTTLSKVVSRTTQSPIVTSIIPKNDLLPSKELEHSNKTSSETPVVILESEDRSRHSSSGVRDLDFKVNSSPVPIITASSTLPTGITTRTRSTTIPITSFSQPTVVPITTHRPSIMDYNIKNITSKLGMNIEGSDESQSVSIEDDNGNLEDILSPAFVNPTSHHRPIEQRPGLSIDNSEDMDIKNNTESTSIKIIKLGDIIVENPISSGTNEYYSENEIDFPKSLQVETEEQINETAFDWSNMVYILIIIGVIPLVVVAFIFIRRHMNRITKALPANEERSEGFTPITHHSKKSINASPILVIQIAFFILFFEKLISNMNLPVSMEH